MSDTSINNDLQDATQNLESLISLIVQGDEQALATLYDQTSTHVYSLVLRVLRDSTLAEEVTLDVYMQVWRKASEFNSTRGRPIVWLAVLARSRAIDRLRVGQKEKANRVPLEDISESLATQVNPETLQANSDQYRVVQKAMASLSSEQRQVIELAYFEGLSQIEIANKIDKPLGTVKTRIRLGMINLRKLLAQFNMENVL